MPTYPTVTKIIKSSFLNKGGAYIENVKFIESNRTLVKGSVCDTTGKPLEGVGVEIVLIDNTSYELKKYILGVVFSDKDGVYAVSLEVKDSYEYELNIYSALPL